MNGVIVINKPKEYTSHDVVAKVKRILGVKKVGHTGTLDPNATGVLPLLLNEGTKISKYLMQHDKEYEVVLKLGIKTDTADAEGNIIQREDVKDISNLEVVLNSFLGKNEQIPPMYSAIKVNGKKLYEYARCGQTVELKPRIIEIYDIEILNINNKENEIAFKVACSKGTYIRSLCEDIAIKLGTVGYMKELKRTKVGKFDIKQSITIDELEKNIEKIKVITIKELLNEFPNIELNKNQLNKFLNGVKISVDKEDGIYNIYSDKYIGTGIVVGYKLKRDVIIN